MKFPYFASGLVVYWITNNLITFGQQYLIMRRHGHKPEVLGNILRSFRREHHATPQQMLMALRLLEAKRRIAAGEPLAQVAAATGLADQAHLTRAFSRRYGVTPARYRQQLQQSGTRPRRHA